VVTFTREIAGGAQHLERDLTTGAETLTADAPALVAGNDFDAGDGHWASCLAGGRLAIDGMQVEGRASGVSMAWPYVLSVVDDRFVLAFSVPGRGYGMKRADAGRPISKDTLAQDIGGGRIRIWDLLNGVGTGRPTQATDHIGAGAPQPTPDPRPGAVPDQRPAVPDQRPGAVPDQRPPAVPATGGSDILRYIDNLEANQLAMIAAVNSLADALRKLQPGNVSIDVQPVVAQIDLLRQDVQKGFEAVRAQIAGGVRVRLGG
jgi:hypothetical protein